VTPDDSAADLRFGELAVSEVNAALQHLERARLLFALVEDNAAGIAAIHDLLAAETEARLAVAGFELPRLWLVPDPADAEPCGG
jgi:hypothetical protein